MNLNLKMTERFRAKVGATGSIKDCWEWRGALNDKGYGKFYVLVDGKSKPKMAHRVSWMITNQDAIPDGMMICHKCDNPSCVNPHHLFLGTAKDNYDDMVSKNRGKPPEVKLGESHSRSKLTELDVLCIRRLKGQIPQSKIGEIFGITQSTVGSILRGETWTEVAQSLAELKAGVLEEFAAGFSEPCEHDTTMTYRELYHILRDAAAKLRNESE